MNPIRINEEFAVSSQLAVSELQGLKDAGVQLLVCNRPDGESAEQIPFSEISSAAAELGIETVNIAFKAGEQTTEDVAALKEILESGKKIHAYCRTGNRSFCLWAAVQASSGASREELIEKGKSAGIDVSSAISSYYDGKITEGTKSAKLLSAEKPLFDIVIVGAGSGGISVASSLLKRKAKLRIALIDPAENHHYQPGWTMVGGGVFDVSSTRRKTKDLIPSGVSWIKQEVLGFIPGESLVELDNGQQIAYQHLIVSPGLTLDWDAVKGLRETLGKNGVTSNYLYELAPYTWELVKELKSGKAIFTQPPMPIKCAGAPQKALYLSADHWLKNGVLKNIDIDFHNAGGVLFGVADYVPALQSYIDKYQANLRLNHNLVEIDGEKKIAYFKSANEEDSELVAEEFDMIHVCPPQKAPDFVANSALAGDGGWMDVDQFTLRHKKFENIWGLGDVLNTPNAKTMAAVRQQVPVVAQNIYDVMAGREAGKGYDGYGSCPLTVENGKIVLAEFGYGGKLLPTFPSWLLEGTNPTRLAWILKADLLPPIYWHAMLKGREWLAAPKNLNEVKN